MTLSIADLFILMAKLYYQVKRYLVFVAQQMFVSVIL